jgi:hypothetical protein
MKITFDEHDTDSISEVFGWDRAKYELCVRKMFLALLEETMDRRSHRTRTQVLHDWLLRSAKALGFSMETGSDIFMLGYGFNNAVRLLDEYRDDRLNKGDDASAGIAIGIPREDSKEATAIIKEKLHEAMDEIKKKLGKSTRIISDIEDDEEEMPKKKLPN